MLVTLTTESPMGKFYAYLTWNGESSAPTWLPANVDTEHNIMAPKIDK